MQQSASKEPPVSQLEEAGRQSDSNSAAGKVVIAGYFGFQNAGDEAILGATIKGLRRLQPRLELVVVSGNPESTSATHHIKSVSYTNLSDIVAEIASSNLVILGGGGLFQDYDGFDVGSVLTPRHGGIGFYSTFPLLATLLNKPLMLNAVGLGPLFADSSRTYVRMAFQQASVATVRDRESKELLISFGLDCTRIKVTADLAFLLEPSPEEVIKPLLAAEGLRLTSPYLIGVSVRPWDTTSGWPSRVAEALDTIVERYGATVVFIPFQQEEGALTDDFGVSNQVAIVMRHRDHAVVLQGQYSPEEKAGIVGLCDVVLGMRLHSIIFAARARVPALGLVYDQKVRSVMRQLGCEDYAVDPGVMSAEELVQLFERALQHEVEWTTRLDSAVSRLTTLAQDNLDLVIESLERVNESHATHSSEVIEFIKECAINLVLSADVTERAFWSQKTRLAAAEQTIEDLSTRLEEKEQALESQSERLLELERIKRSRAWRWLNSYGKIKYRYLLPLYRLLAVSPRSKKLASHPQGQILFGVMAEESKSIDDLEAVNYQTFGEPEVQSDKSNKTNIPGPHRNYDVFCLPIIDFDFRFQRPQQLCRQFAQDGYRVFYVRSYFHQSGPTVLLREIEERIFDVQIPGPPNVNFYKSEIDETTLRDFLGALDDLRSGVEIDEVVCIVQLPFWTPLALEVQRQWGWKIIYDCMDEHSGFSTNDSVMLNHEEVLMSRADLVSATSRALETKTRLLSKKVLLLPNAADFEHFNKPGPLRPLPENSQPTIGYFGAIGDWFDVDMVRRAAEDRPNWRFVLIGMMWGVDVSSLERLSNVYLLGEQPYATLPGYLHQFDIACIPFLINSLTQATDPVKFYEYLSAGKPVVATELPELMPHRDYFYAARSSADFVAQIELALKEQSAEKISARVEFARLNTWQARYSVLSSSIAELKEHPSR